MLLAEIEVELIADKLAYPRISIVGELPGPGCKLRRAALDLQRLVKNVVAAGDAEKLNRSTRVAVALDKSPGLVEIRECGNVADLSVSNHGSSFRPWFANHKSSMPLTLFQRAIQILPMPSISASALKSLMMRPPIRWVCSLSKAMITSIPGNWLVILSMIAFEVLPPCRGLECQGDSRGRAQSQHRPLSSPSVRTTFFGSS